MKKYSILNQSNEIVGCIQVNDNIPYSELQAIYGNIVEENNDVIIHTLFLKEQQKVLTEQAQPNVAN